MELTGLEAILGGAVLSGAVGIVTWLVTSARYQTRTGCDERHAGVCRDIFDLKAKQDRDTSLVMRMLRSLILYSDMPEAEKERVLNDRTAQ